jgi:polyhydroxybutyrate depolymerase
MKHIACLVMMTLFTQSVFAQTFRDKMRERIKERMTKKAEEKPAPVTDVIGEKITKAGDYTLSLSHGGLTRLYKLHVPVNYDGNKATPLLVALHGGGGDMSYQAEEKYYHQISKSDKEGFVVLFPNGYSKFNSGKFATWNAGKCCGDARDKNIDDVGFIRELVNKTSSQLNIDKNKIFAAGMSNGGMMSYRIACELTDVFKAIASVAGTDNTPDCSPKNPISILHIHAQDDDHVLFNGGSGKALARSKTQVTEFVSVPATIAKWVKEDGCKEGPKRVLEVSGAYCDSYSSCKKNTEVKLCVTSSGGHSWPGGEKVRGSASTSQAISANDVMWDFFKGR